MSKFKEEKYCGLTKETYSILMEKKRKRYPKTVMKIESVYPNLTGADVKEFSILINSPYKSSFSAMDINNYFKKLNEFRK